MKRTLAAAALALALAGYDVVRAHDIPWPAGMSRRITAGTCAKGPCARRVSFAETIPHRHLPSGLCVSLGAGGYRANRTFACPAR